MSSQKSRRGTAADRGRVLRWPTSGVAPEPAPQGFWATLRHLGPGIVTGAADVDPSLVITATVVGAAFHYSLLWVVVLCVPFLLVTFAVTGRIGYQTQRGLVDLLRENYGRGWATACALIIVAINMAMIIADLMAVSDAFSIILNQSRWFFVTATAFSVWYVLIYHDYRRVTRALLWLSIPLYVYVAAAIIAAPGWKAVLLGIVTPRATRSPEYIGAIVALFGSLLTPYVLVWQTGSRREHARSGGAVPHRAESMAGTFITTILCFSIVVAASAVLHLPRALDMTTRQAAEALRPAVGNVGEALFALGIIGAGMVALPVLAASMCYSISESQGWKAGLSEHPWEAKRFYVLISVAMFVAAAANFAPINPVKALYWSQILAGILIVPILAFALVLSNDRRIMITVNTRAQNFWLGAATGGLVATGVVYAWWVLLR